MKPLRRILCIDPSIRAMGYAFFDQVQQSKPWAKWVLSDSGCYTYAERDTYWHYALDAMVDAVEGLVCGTDTDPATLAHVFVERPDHVRTDPGSVLKLMACAYSIRQMLLPDWPVTMLDVNEWKGNVPKEVTQRRIRKHWGWGGTDHNEADAVGIGDYVLRKAKLV